MAIPRGYDEIEVTFKPKHDFTVEEFMETFMTDAQKFDMHVRGVHKIPQDADTWKRLNVESVLYELSALGHYPIAELIFKDGSRYTPVTGG